MREFGLHAAGKLLRAIVLGMLLCFAVMAANTGSATGTEQQAWTLYEAEEAELDGTAVQRSRPGFSGEGYSTSFEMAGDAVKFTVTVEEEGYYALRIGYASPYGDKTNYIEVNGNTAGEMMFPQTEAFAEIDFGLVELDEGDNRIDISTYWGFFDVDYILLGGREERRPVAEVEPVLVTPEPSREAQALMEYMTSHYGKGILTGQQRTSSAELDYIYGVSGKLPVVSGFPAEEGIDMALEWAKHGGIVTMEWHWGAPGGERAVLASETGFDADKAVTPGTPEYDRTIADIDRMAAQLLRLKREGVPVLWRPLHEAEGGWFWWGAKGPETAKKLYGILFDRFTRHHGLNNLIWVWTTSDSAHSKAWYPGDEVVDIVGVDRYMRDGDYSPLLSVYDKLSAMVDGKKLVAYTENGPMPDPKQLKRQKIGWMYFNTWGGRFIADGMINSRHHVRAVYNHPYSITLDEFPSEEIYGRASVPYPVRERKQTEGRSL